MPVSPKIVEDKINRMSSGWKTLAPDKSFGGMTFKNFEAEAAPSLDVRRLLAENEDQRMQLLAARDTADENFLAKSQLVVNGVLADPTEGENSALYEAFGYVRKSERKSGLTRKKKTGGTPVNG